MSNRIRAIVLVLLSMLLSLSAWSQTKIAQVVLRNGTVLTGTLQELDPLSHVVINIAGLETCIEIGQIASIQAEDLTTAEITPEPPFMEDLSELPDSFVIHSGDEDIEMVLIRGGDFMMGFDGRHSMDYRSEPVHPVRLNSFYISKAVLTNAQVTAYTGRKTPFVSWKASFSTQSWSKANDIAKAVATRSGYPARLVTESEWEYIAASDRKSILEWFQDESDWCHDYYEKEYPVHRVLNPMGPESGRGHVIRQWDMTENEIYARKDGHMSDDMACVRIVIPAAEFKNK